MVQSRTQHKFDDNNGYSTSLSYHVDFEGDNIVQNNIVA